MTHIYINSIMKHTFIINARHPRLLLFFAGWGADATPFAHYRPAGHDFAVCYDYRTLRLPLDTFYSYHEIDIVAWSMGVWAASYFAPMLPVPVGRSIAINGTPWPIDQMRGIPPDIYDGTLQGLDERNLHKFLRRMCADSQAFRAFLDVTPRRPLQELRDELQDIRHQWTVLPAPGFRWQEAVVGMADRIIPPENQLLAWRQLGVPVTPTDDAHYQETLFRHYLEEIWTND